MENLEIKNISFKNHTKSASLKNISLTVKPNEIICLVGPSGSGKTTLLRLIAGLLKTEDGSIVMDKRNITNEAIYDRRIGFVPKKPSLLPNLTILENVLFSIREHRGNKNNTALKLLEELGLKHLAYQYPDNLTPGQKQNIAILRAIATNPKIMLFDESFASFDKINKEDLIEKSLQLIRGIKCYKILVTDNPQEALLYADRIYVMNNGEIEQFGTPSEIYHTPKNIYVTKLFGRINNFKVKLKGRVIETPLGKIENYLNKTYHEADIIIRPNTIAIHTLRIASSVQAVIVTKRFLAEGNYYIAKLDSSSHNIKVISKVEIELGDKVYLKISKYHLIGY